MFTKYQLAGLGFGFILLYAGGALQGYHAARLFQQPKNKVADYAVCDLYSAESRAEDTHKKISDRYEDGYAVHYIQYYDNQDNTVCYLSISTDAAAPKGKR